MTSKTLIALLLFSGIAFAANPAPKIGPQLTSTEKIALASVQQEYQRIQQEQQQAQQKLGMIEADIARQHPGYHLDVTTLTLVANSPTPNAPQPTKKK